MLHYIYQTYLTMSFYEWGKVVSCSAYMCIQLKESEINWKSLIDVRTWV